MESMIYILRHLSFTCIFLGFEILIVDLCVTKYSVHTMTIYWTNETHSFIYLWCLAYVSRGRIQEVPKHFFTPWFPVYRIQSLLGFQCFLVQETVHLPKGILPGTRVLLWCWQYLSWKPGNLLQKPPKGRLLHMWDDLNAILILIQNIIQKIIREIQIKTTMR